MPKCALLHMKLGEIVVTVNVEPHDDRTVFLCKRCGLPVHTALKSEPEEPTSIMRVLLVHELRCFAGKSR